MQKKVTQRDTEKSQSRIKEKKLLSFCGSLRFLPGPLWNYFLWIAVLLLLVGCQPAQTEPAPTRALAAALPSPQTALPTVPPTFTPLPETAVALPTPIPRSDLNNQNAPPTATRFIPTSTPVPPSPTPTRTPLGGPKTPGPTETPPIIKPLNQYGPQEIIPYQAFPTPPGDNGWGMHWMPTVSQEPAVVDRFVGELVRMHIKWLVFLNDGTNIGANDYLVEKLTANGIMPVMRLYRSGILPYDGHVGDLVAHYRPKGVYYYQLYNEPNVNVENHQGFANPNQYALTWAAAAREVIANGGLPGIGALSPGGAYNHYDFLDRTLRAIEFNGDSHLLNHAWLSVHNYHGTRPLDDPDGFLLFRNYDLIVHGHLGRSLPMIGTEGGSYHPNLQADAGLIAWQYQYMQEAEPYYLAFSYWLLANREGGGHDDTWEWQTLFRPGFVHPVVGEFFYRNGR